jgi:hypothetical protein
MKLDKRIHRINLHLNDKEQKLFEQKAKNYKQMSAMIRDAVAQFDDKKSKGWIKSLNELSTQMADFSLEISRQGANLNQITKRANELIYMGELEKEYYDEVIIPQVNNLQKLMNDVKKQQSEIFKRLLNL